MTEAMMKLVRQHLDCDAQLNRCEIALHKGELATAGRNFRLFDEELEHHFELEEQRLFPAFEAATGISAGPTMVLRREHAEIRNLRDEAYAAIEAGDKEAALCVLDTLNVLIQQHNVKEENVLYPMCGGSVPNLNQVLGFASTCCASCSCG